MPKKSTKSDMYSINELLSKNATIVKVKKYGITSISIVSSTTNSFNDYESNNWISTMLHRRDIDKFLRISPDKYSFLRDIKNIEILNFSKNLVFIDISFSNLDNIPVLPKKLEVFKCTQCNLNELPKLPTTLQELSCDGNRLTNIGEELPLNLNILIIYNNLIRKLPEKLPPKLITLLCCNNPIYTMPELPITLTTLECSGSRLNELPFLHEGLLTLNCSMNQINKLKNIPISLNELNISDNNISILPIFPEKNIEKIKEDLNMTHISCEKLKILCNSEVLKNNSFYLNCRNNPLSKYFYHDSIDISIIQRNHKYENFILLYNFNLSRLNKITYYYYYRIRKNLINKKILQMIYDPYRIFKNLKPYEDDQDIFNRFNLLRS